MPRKHLPLLAAGLRLPRELDLAALQALTVVAGCTASGVPPAIVCPEEPPYNSKASLEDMLSLGNGLGTRAQMVHEQALTMLGSTLYGHFCEVFPRDRAEELLGVHYIVAAGGVPALMAPLHLGCQLLLVPADGPYVYTGHNIRPAIIWKRGRESLVAFGQTTLGVVSQSRRYRVDLLVWYRQGSETAHWMNVEFDGGYHAETADQDARRAVGIGTLEIRFENLALRNEDFFERCLLREIRRKATWAASKSLH